MNYSTLSIIASLITVCTASVDFTHSTLYDINDFVGQDELSLRSCDNGCIIYASTMGNGFVDSPTDYDPYAEQLLIQDDKLNQFGSITDLSRKFDEKSVVKTPLIFTGPVNVSVVNLNTPDNTSWPIVLYVIEAAEAKKFSYNVYDVINDVNTFLKVSINPNVVTTVMSAEPFNLVAKKLGAPNGLVARLTGFENVRSDNGDGCPYAFNMKTQDIFPGFNLNINGPIISLLFNERRAVEISASFQFIKILLTQSMLILTWMIHTVITGNKHVTEVFEETDSLQIVWQSLSGDQGFLMRYTAEDAERTTKAAETSTVPSHSSTKEPTTSVASSSSSTTTTTSPTSESSKTSIFSTSASSTTSMSSTATSPTQSPTTSRSAECSLICAIAVVAARRLF